MLGPALLFGVLPELYYGNYCKLVRVYQILMQDEITPEEVAYTDKLYTEFSDEFELIYIQRKGDCLHMACQSIHSGSHNAAETTRLGPLMNTSQWTMERAIGLLVEGIQSHVHAFSNLSQIARRYCQINSLLAAIPDLDLSVKESTRQGDIGEGYFLSQPHD
jgi:hypothetical protein